MSRRKRSQARKKTPLATDRQPSPWQRFEPGWSGRWIPILFVRTRRPAMINLDRVMWARNYTVFLRSRARVLVSRSPRLSLERDLYLSRALATYYGRLGPTGARLAS